MKPAHTGFTLIELILTLAIIALLATLAYPSYRDAALKGRRAEGRTALTDFLQQQERYFTQHGRYHLSQGDDNGPFKRHSSDNPDRSAYTLSSRPCTEASLDTTECVRLIASPAAPDPQVGDLILDSIGPTRSCSGPRKTLCWP